MRVEAKSLNIKTAGNTDIIDITDDVGHLLGETGLKDGSVTVSVIGSTASVSTCEFEPGLVGDLKKLFEELIPSKRRYAHDDTWQDGNGHSHLRASLLGHSRVFVFSDGRLCLGTWQQIIFIDFDTRGRQRKIICQFIGQ